jgi:osmotically-inducible protein OsmY
MNKSLRTAFAAAAIVAGFASTASFAQSPSEELTSRSVLSQIDKDAALRADALHVETVGGTVYLNGQVDSAVESANAEKAALSVPNVNKVVNLLGYGSSN